MARIVYLTFPANEITGGIKIAFQHVEALRKSGLNAVTASQGAVRPKWFNTNAPVADVSTVTDNDILVFPENHNLLLKLFIKKPNRKLVFCQNQYYVVGGLGGSGGVRDYADFGVSGIICSSRSVADYCQMRFPKMPMAIVPVGIDPNLFKIKPKKLQVAFVPRKRPMEAMFIWDLFCAKNPEFASMPWIAMQNATESQVAEVLSESAIKLSLCRFESFGLTILEAMLSGCVVVGFTGFGAREFTTTKNGYWSEEDDCLRCVELLGSAVRLAQKGGPVYTDLISAARVTALSYSLKAMNSAVTEFWTNYLAKELDRFAKTEDEVPIVEAPAVGPAGPFTPF